MSHRSCAPHRNRWLMLGIGSSVALAATTWAQLPNAPSSTSPPRSNYSTAAPPSATTSTAKQTSPASANLPDPAAVRVTNPYRETTPSGGPLRASPSRAATMPYKNATSPSAGAPAAAANPAPPTGLIPVAVPTTSATRAGGPTATTTNSGIVQVQSTARFHTPAAAPPAAAATSASPYGNASSATSPSAAPSNSRLEIRKPAPAVEVAPTPAITAPAPPPAVAPKTAFLPKPNAIPSQNPDDHVPPGLTVQDDLLPVGSAATNAQPAAPQTNVVSRPNPIATAAPVGAVPAAPNVAIVSDDGAARQSLPAAASTSTTVEPVKTPRPSSTTAPATPLTIGKIEPIDFNGVLIGQTTTEEVVKSWGAPIERETDQGITRYRYQIEPFNAIDVSFADDKALSIVVDLGRTFAPDEVARELGIGELIPVPIDDEQGRPLGLVYPERAVSLRFADEGPARQVAFVGIDMIDARPFVLRAEHRLATECSAALADLEAAIKLDPQNAQAHGSQSELLARLGRRREALAAVETALKLEPRQAEFLLTRASLLAQAGMFDAAQADVAAAIEATAAAPQLQARAWCVRGDLFADGPTRDYAQALDAHTRAARLGEPLLKDARPAVARAARELMIDVHLAIAQDIAWGNFQAKDAVVAKWLTKAEKLADGWNATSEVSSDAPLRVRRKALAALVALQGSSDPTPWTQQLETLASEAIARCGDPLRRREIEWEAGLGMYDALQSYHTRGEVDRALHCGEKAVEWMTLGLAGRDEVPTDPYRFGRLYFRVGSLYAIHRDDHRSAVTWFDRAAPLLERPLPEMAAADRGRQGETLVSMGVSYWSAGKRERAVELTQLGGKYMEQSVADGLLARDALGVPYGNLAAMYRDLGQEQNGRRFEELAARVEPLAAPQRR